MSLYDDQRSHSVSSVEDYGDELELSPKNNAATEGLMALQRRSSLINIGQIQKQVEHADEHTLEQEISSLEKRYNTLKSKMKNMK